MPGLNQLFTLQELVCNAVVDDNSICFCSNFTAVCSWRTKLSSVQLIPTLLVANQVCHHSQTHMQCQATRHIYIRGYLLCSLRWSSVGTGSSATKSIPGIPYRWYWVGKKRIKGTNGVNVPTDKNASQRHYVYDILALTEQRGFSRYRWTFWISDQLSCAHASKRKCHKTCRSNHRMWYRSSYQF